MGFDAFGELNPLDGVQLYVFPPTAGAPIVQLCPMQMFGLEPVFAAGRESTVSVAVLEVAVPDALVKTTRY